MPNRLLSTYWKKNNIKILEDNTFSKKSLLNVFFLKFTSSKSFVLLKKIHFSKILSKEIKLLKKRAIENGRFFFDG